MKKGPEIFTEILDLVCASLPYGVISRRLRLSPSIIFKWINECHRAKKDDTQNKIEIGISRSIYVFEWGGVVDWFTNHIRTAMRASVLEIEATARNNCLGTFEPVYFQGRKSWQEDEKLVGVDDETLAILGLPDRYKRDRDGNRIQNVVMRPGSPQLVSFMLKSQGGKAYADKRSVEHTGNLSVGVSVLNDRPPSRIAPPATPPAQVAQSVAAEIIEDADYTEVEQETEAAPAPMVADEPTADEAPAHDPFAASRAERAVRLNAEAAAAVTHPRPGTPAPARPPQPSRPPTTVHATSKYQSDDEKMERLGAGVVAPGGVKVR
jgi:hypothetical protein